MGRRIKVTGYVPVDDLDQEHVDLSHETGLSGKGFDMMNGMGDVQPWSLADLEDLDFTLEPEGSDG